MKVQHKLFLAITPTALALLIIGFLSISTISKLGEHSQIILKDNFLSVLAVQRMMEASERLDSAALFRLAGKASESSSITTAFIPVFEAQLAIQEGNITETGEKETTHLLRGEWIDYRNACQALQALPQNETSSFYFSGLLPRFKKIKEHTEQILTLNQNGMVSKSNQVRNTAHQMVSFTFFGIVFASLAGVLFSLFLGKHFLRPLSVLSQSVRRVGEGDLEARARIPGNDEFALLAKEFNQMADHLLQYRNSSIGELLFAQQSTQAAIDSLPDPVMIYDSSGTIINFNAVAEREIKVTSWLKSSETGFRPPPPLKAILDKAIQYVLSQKIPFSPKGLEEAIVLATSDGEKYFLPRGFPLLDEGRIMGVTVVLQDVTRLRLFDQLKTDLVSTVAHEFRTPLTSLRMAIHLLLERSVGDLSEKQDELLHAGREECERLQTMVDELLDLSRMQSGKIKMNMENVSAQQIVESTMMTHQLLADESGRSIESSLDPELLRIRADAERIILVLKNLLVNAIRHTPPEGRIAIRLRRDETHAVFEVEDHGEGIPEEYHARVFERFFRVPGIKSIGTGLGLSISKEIVEAHGGTIGFKSQAGKGSLFWFSLPLS